MPISGKRLSSPEYSRLCHCDDSRELLIYMPRVEHRVSREIYKAVYACTRALNDQSLWQVVCKINPGLANMTDVSGHRPVPTSMFLDVEVRREN